ncbi:hypothetical protein [Macellibacteroides fermentans]|uniref:hypothetical protein n=1 Tax=Macellibacteroides fermentans TaxID=879969 RepID=UPI00406D3CFD
MGWAKYYEDNISIYNNRMALMEPEMAAVSICRIKISVTNSQKAPTKMFKVKNTGRGSRSGIMLFFNTDVECSVARKLQMNGWWFSKANNCWCNYNNPANRRYAQRLALNQKRNDAPIGWRFVDNR